MRPIDETLFVDYTIAGNGWTYTVESLPKAVARCLPVILENGLVELKVKEYPEPAPDDFKTIAKGPGGSIQIAKIEPASEETAKNGPFSALNDKNDKLPIPSVHAPNSADLPKITVASELLEQNDF